MKRHTLFLLIFLVCNFSLIAQEKPSNNSKLYNPSADAKKDISNVIAQAKKENKHVFLQIGGNWCGWCIAFDKKVNENEELKKILNDNYVIYHLNYSNENTNSEILKELGYPQRFGFPVFVILDSDGNRLHTQNSAYLEEGKGHSVEKVKEFLDSWTINSLDPANYKDKKK
jgi:thioredoxin-related protein